METQQTAAVQEQIAPSGVRFFMSDTVTKIIPAFARAQGKYKPLVKNCEGKVTYSGRDGSQGGSYTFRYSDLGAVIEATSEALSGEEMVHTALIGGGKIRVMLLHSSGEWMASEAPLPAPGEVGVQKFGGWVTYLRRYLLSALLGVASEDDDDVNAATGNQFEKSAKPATAPKPAPAPKPEPEKPVPVAALLARLTEIKIEGKDAVLKWMADNLGHKVAATKDLKPAEVAKLQEIAYKSQPAAAAVAPTPVTGKAA
jgi:hypothetical protein